MKENENKLIVETEELKESFSKTTEKLEKNVRRQEKIVVRSDKRQQQKYDELQDKFEEVKALQREIEETQKEVVFTMGAIDESRSKETGNHVKRVAGYTNLFALYCGLDERELLKTAATVAYEHHEKWDGTGYPRGLAAEEIHIYDRITAIADVFDALGSDRCYNKAWNDEKIFGLLKEERGRHFDPKLVDIFFDHLDEFLAIRDKFKDVF